MNEQRGARPDQQEVRAAFREKRADDIEVAVGEYDHEEAWADLPRIGLNEAEAIFDVGVEASPELSAYFTKLEQDLHDQEPEVVTGAQASLSALLHELLNRGFMGELPLADGVEHSFMVRRNLEIVKGLLPSVYKLVDHLTPGSKFKLDEAGFQKTLDDAQQLAAIEQTKSHWVEAHLFPKMYERAIRTARSEVTQFLLTQVNSTDAALTHFNDIEKTSVSLEDSLTAKLKATNETLDARGLYRGSVDHVTLVIPSTFGAQDEWRVYLTAVHEFTHAASDQSAFGKVGISKTTVDGEITYNEVNEAVTEIVAHIIAQDREGASKTLLKKKRGDKPDLSRSGYANYIGATQDTFHRVPEQLFIDAMLTERGLATLQDAFTKAYGSTQTLLDFSQYLRKLR